MSVTGQVGYVSIAKQSAHGTANTTDAKYTAVKITGDSLVANNNMLVAEGEIGIGRDVSQAVPGGFAAAGAINGNLRVRTAAVFLEAALGTSAVVPGAAGPPETVDVDQFTPADDIPYLTIEKKIGTSSPQRIFLRYTDSMVNTLNITVPPAALATFSAGVVAAGESELASATDTSIDYDAKTDDLLVFHGGRVRHADTGTPLVNTHDNSTFQNLEFVINNNIITDEYTIRPSRFLRDLTEGIRSVETNMTIVFEDNAAYEKYTYGATGRTSPGYQLYKGALELFLGNWQVVSSGTAANDESADFKTPADTTVSDYQALEIVVPKLAFSGLPVALQQGRIAVTTTARALKPTSGNILSAITRPKAAGLS